MSRSFAWLFLTCVVLVSFAEIYEKWRVADMAKLSPAKQAEFEADKQESNRRYDAAFDEVLAHTSDAELSAFWSAFSAESRDKPWTMVTLQPQNNPMHDNVAEAAATSRVKLQAAPHTNDAAAAVVQRQQADQDDGTKEEEQAVI